MLKRHSPYLAAFLRRWLAVALWLLALPTLAADVLDVAQSDHAPVALTQYFSVLEDTGGQLSFAEVRQPDIAARFKNNFPAGESLGFGYTRSAYWLKITLRNTSDQPRQKLFEIAYSRLSHVQFHHPDAKADYREIATGGVMPFTERPYKNRNFVFPLMIPPHAEQTLYLRVQAISSILIPARLWEPEQFHVYERNDYLAQAWYFGMVTAMVLFNLLLWVGLRDIVYLLYVNFISLGALSIASQNGLGKEFIWHEAPQWSDISTTVTYSLAINALFMFMRHMLTTWQTVPRLDRLFKFCVGFYLIYPLSFFIAPQVFIKPTALIYFVGMALVLGTGIYCAVVKKMRSGLFFAAAFTVLMLSGLMTALRLLGILPSNIVTLNGLQVGSALEMILLAFALADRFNEIRREKAKAQREALDAQKELVETLKSSERLLEERVARRTAELSTANAALNDAVVVAESSRQQAEEAQKQATQTLEDLRATQAQLVQSEKMASLGQLVANIAHEINTPIGAVKSSGKNIADALDHSLAHMPKVFQHLDDESITLFLRLIGRANGPRPTLSTREERAITREITRDLESLGIADAQHKAGILVQLNAQLAVKTYLPLLTNPECDLILETAYSIAKIINNTHNINAAVERVSKIIFALKSFSHSDHRGEKTDIDLERELETVLIIYQHQLRQGTEVVRQYEPIPALRCFADELNQVWTNLIHNALQAMNYKGRLIVSIGKKDGHAVVSIGDTGSGIPENIRSKIFEPFFTTKAAGEGSGLGLDIVKRIVDKHQGRIEVASEMGKGTSFSVYLPYPTVSQ